jgi:thiol-disulfide isomerase/thioredoxin
VRIKKLLVALLIASAMAVSGCTRRATQSEALDIGRPAPAFTLPDVNGRQVSLNQFKGKVVLLDFWATWCGPCRMTMPLLENLQKEYPDKMVLLAVNLQESREEVQKYLQAQNLHSQVLLDEEGRVGETYGTASIPMQVLIDKGGIVRYIQIGFSERTIKTLREEIGKLL